MPKIIENLREKLLSEARRMVSECGYSAFTVRDLSAACGVGVGTVYNYFPSKEHLIASFLAEDWRREMERIETACGDASARDILLSEYDLLRRFYESHRKLFTDPAAVRVYSSLPRERHMQMRHQLVVPVERALVREGRQTASFDALFLCEALLTWAVALVPKETLFLTMDPILNKGKEGI